MPQASSATNGRLYLTKVRKSNHRLYPKDTTFFYAYTIRKTQPRDYFHTPLDVANPKRFNKYILHWGVFVKQADHTPTQGSDFDHRGV